MSNIVILRGLQASGKSTFAKEWVSKDPKKRARWNRDSIREMCCTEYTPKTDGIQYDLIEPFILGMVGAGIDVVIDDTNLSEKALTRLKGIIDKCPGTIVSKVDFFDVPLETCIERNKMRGGNVPEVAITGTYRRYKDVLTGLNDPWNKVFVGWSGE